MRGAILLLVVLRSAAYATPAEYVLVPSSAKLFMHASEDSGLAHTDDRGNDGTFSARKIRTLPSGWTEIETAAAANDCHDGTDELMVESLKRGAKAVGAAPNYDTDHAGQIRRVFEMAREFDVDIDMHLDSGHTPEDLDAVLVCELTEKYGLGGRVAVGHGCKYSTMPVRDLTCWPGRGREVLGDLFDRYSWVGGLKVSDEVGGDPVSEVEEVDLTGQRPGRGGDGDTSGGGRT